MGRQASGLKVFMSKTELIDKLNELGEKDRDIEANHLAADDLLLEFINDAEVSEAFASIEKWYA